MMNRREALKTTALATAAVATFLPTAHSQQAAPKTNAPAPATGAGPFTLPPLPYAFDALEPLIDAQTMELHHDKHHAAYVANLNKALAGYPDLQKKSVEDLLKNLDAVPEAIRTAVRNNAGGHYNHSLFWQMMKKHGGGEPPGALGSMITRTFNSFMNFQTLFGRAAFGQFGSGWAWLVMNPDGKLAIETTDNQDSPISSGKGVVMGIDVWEHAYYLKYHNLRVEYIKAWYNLINWDFVLDRYQKLIP